MPYRCRCNTSAYQSMAHSGFVYLRLIPVSNRPGTGPLATAVQHLSIASSVPSNPPNDPPASCITSIHCGFAHSRMILNTSDTHHCGPYPCGLDVSTDGSLLLPSICLVHSALWNRHHSSVEFFPPIRRSSVTHYTTCEVHRLLWPCRWHRAPARMDILNSSVSQWEWMFRSLRSTPVALCNEAYRVPARSFITNVASKHSWVEVYLRP
jgi:hypothetical protein